MAKSVKLKGGRGTGIGPRRGTLTSLLKSGLRFGVCVEIRIKVWGFRINGFGFEGLGFGV